MYRASPPSNAYNSRSYPRKFSHDKEVLRAPTLSVEYVQLAEPGATAPQHIFGTTLFKYTHSLFIYTHSNVLVVLFTKAEQVVRDVLHEKQRRTEQNPNFRVHRGRPEVLLCIENRILSTQWLTEMTQTLNAPRSYTRNPSPLKQKPTRIKAYG